MMEKDQSSSTNSASGPDNDTSPNIDKSPASKDYIHEQKDRRLWKFHLRPDDDHEEQDWWFCSTAIPLLAATSGPLANVMSIAGA